MWITYTYDVGSIYDNTENFCLEVPDNLISLGELTYDDIFNLLQDHSAYLSDSTILSVYDYHHDAYRRIKPTEKFSISETSDLDILIKGCQLSEIAYTVDKVQDIEERIWGLEQQLGTHENAADANLVKEEVDIAVLYAAPLVRQDKINIKNCDNWNLDFSKERGKLLETFKQNEINANIKFEVATLENLSAILECKPKIVHISCHGYYKDGNKNEFVLAFESGIKLGMREEVTIPKLKRILQFYKDYNGIFMISACYSQATEQAFVDSGIKFLISVHDQCKIHDDAAIGFSAIFYRNLFKGRLITQAFEEARTGVKNIQATIQSCCCTHNHTCKHSDHKVHEPTSDCECEKRYNASIHRVDCKWALKFNQKLAKTRVLTAEETESGYWEICCCYPNMVPHTEHNKFRLRNFGNVQDFALFSGREAKRIKDLQAEVLLKPDSVDRKITGRGKEMKDIIEKLSGKNRILVLHGKSGIGKTLIIKHVSNYAFERKMFNDGVIYIDMKGKDSLKCINSMMAKKLNSPSDTKIKYLAQLIDNMHILVVIDNIQFSDTQKLAELSAKISTLHERAQYPKFCVVLEDKISIDQAETYEVKALQETAVANLIKSDLDPGLYEQIRSNLKELIRIIDCSPSYVFDIISQLKTNPIQQVILAQKARQPTKTQTETDSLALKNYLIARYENSQRFLNIIGKFPGGVYKEDLEILCNFTCKQILVTISEQKSLLLDTSNEIFSVPKSLRDPNKHEAPVEDALIFYRYLALLAKSVFNGFMSHPAYQSLDPLKSYTGLFFTECPENTEDLSNVQCGVSNKEKLFNCEYKCPAFEAGKNADVVFKEMEKNFKRSFKAKRLNWSYSKNDQDTLSQYISEICMNCARIYLLLGQPTKAEKILTEVIRSMKNLSQHYLKMQLKLFLAFIRYESQCANNSQVGFDELRLLESSVEKARLFFDHKGSVAKMYMGQCYLLKSLLIVKLLKREGFNENLRQAKQIFLEIGKEVELARLYMIRADWKFLKDKVNKDLIRELVEAKEVFHKISAKGLEEKAIFALGKSQMLTGSREAAQEAWTDGLRLAESIKDRKMETEFKEKLSRTLLTKYSL